MKRKYKNPNGKNPLLLIGLLILILAGMFYLYYDKNQKGFLQVNSLDETLVIYIDNNKENSKNDINPEFKIKNGNHSVVIHKENHWPWTKEVEISNLKKIEVNPFFVPQNTNGFIIGTEDPEYWTILNSFKENLILEEALDKISTIEIKSQIKAIDFYKNREDVILMALAEGVYALGVDYETEQNLQPIYKGKNPVFIKKNDSSIYILDNNNLMEVNY